MMSVLNKTQSAEVQQINELLHEIESEYNPYLTGSIRVEMYPTATTANKLIDIKEIHIPVNEDTDIVMLQEDLEDLLVLLRNTNSEIYIDQLQENTVTQKNKVTQLKAINGEWSKEGKE